MHTNNKNNYIAIGTVCYLLVAFCAVFIMLSQTPDGEQFTDLPADQFSQQTALEHLRNISDKPHFTGSQSHLDVQKYLVEKLTEMGLHPEVTQHQAMGSKYYVASKVENIIARLPGEKGIKTGNKALALVSHYDSATYSSLGASDAGSGVVAILEALRAFIASKQPQENDIIIIFTDAEEQGLLGAEAFVAEHPWAKEIGLVLNFEARGSGGPSYMLLETNKGNRALIQAFSDANVNYPQSNSLMYSIYKMLPNDTDLTVFREQGNINGFNFAFIDDHFDYHTQQDTPERLDKETLNHQADYLNVLVPYFANTNLSALDSEADDVFFNFANISMVQYPFSWAWPLFVLASIIFIAAIIYALKQKLVTIRKLAWGTAAIFGSLAVAFAIGKFGWAALLLAFPQYSDSAHGFTYNGHAIIGAAILLTIAAILTICARLQSSSNPTTVLSVLLPISFVWWLINLLICIYLPGANFFIIPLFGALLPSLLLLIQPRLHKYLALIVTTFWLPGFIILAAQIPTFVIGLGMGSLFIATLLTALLFLLIVPMILITRGRKTLQLLSVILAIGTFAYATAHSGFDANNKKATSINYVWNVDTDRGYLFSYNRVLDSFTEQFFTTTDKADGEFNKIYPVSRRRDVTFTKPVAEPLDLLAADVKASVVKTNDERYSVELTIFPQRQNNMMQIAALAPMTINQLHLNHKPFKVTNLKRRGHSNIVRVVITNGQAQHFKFDISSPTPPRLQLIETKFDLPNQWPNFIPRPETMMPEPFLYTDATIITQSIAVK